MGRGGEGRGGEGERCRVDVVVGRRGGRDGGRRGAVDGRGTGSVCHTRVHRSLVGWDTHAGTLRVHGPAFVDSAG
jgi:hypothetical protein